MVVVFLASGPWLQALLNVQMNLSCRQETFAQMFLGSLKRGRSKESELAARALGVLMKWSGKQSLKKFVMGKKDESTGRSTFD